MNYSTVILGVVLAFFGILFLLLIVYIIKINKSKSNIKGGGIRMPPLNYMREIGSKCPDYWVYMGKDTTKTGYHICHNAYNIPTQPSNSTCYDDEHGRTKSFKDSKMDSDGNMDPDAEKERCNFVKQCGPTTETKASWLGINSEQMSPGYVNCGLV